MKHIFIEENKTLTNLSAFSLAWNPTSKEVVHNSGINSTLILQSGFGKQLNISVN